MQRLLSKANNQMESGNVRPEMSVFLELQGAEVPAFAKGMCKLEFLVDITEQATP